MHGFDTILTGEKIFLGSILEEDVPKIVGWKNDKSLSELILSEYRPVSLDEGIRWLQLTAGDKGQKLFGIYTKKERILIGISRLMFIDLRNGHAEFGIYLGNPMYYGRGFGTEATQLTFFIGFNQLNLNKIYLKVDEQNERAVRVYEKIGMQKEGVLVKHARVNNCYRNLLFMSIFQSQFQFQLPDTF